MRTLILLAFVLSIGSIQGQKVTGDSKETADFSAYKTYQFVGWQDDSDKIMNDFDKDRLRESIKAEMAARNFELVESGADMAVSLFVVVDQKTSASSYTNFYGGAGYGRGRRYGGGWGNGHASTTYTESDYRVGTLVLDILEEESKDLLWQGVATGTISEKPKKREKRIPKAIAKLMKKFPVEAVK